MKKIGIITFHRALNYGAKLQAYALQETLKAEYDVSIIDYRCPFIENIYYNPSFKKKKSIKHLIKNVLYYKKLNQLKIAKKLLYDEFLKFDLQYLNISSIKYLPENIVEANNEYDYFIAGSDQIWNLRLTGHDWNYFLEFANNSKKYSYAASFGGEIQNDDIIDIANKLKSFQSLLVRERSGVNLLNKILESEKDVKSVCDPVFLLSREQWFTKLNLKKATNCEKYILVMEVAPALNVFAFAQNLAAKKNYKIYYINQNGRIRLPHNFIGITSVSPHEFLELIANAKYVITTSFHAMAFSIIFNVPFFYELDKSAKNNNDRLSNLAEIFDIKEKEIKSEALVEDWNNTQWEDINNKLKRYAIDSKQILLQSIR